MPEVFKRLRLLKSKTSIHNCARPAMSAHQMQGKMIVPSLPAGVRWTRVYFRYPQVRRLGDRRLGIGAHNRFVLLAGDHRQRTLARTDPFEDDRVDIHSSPPCCKSIGLAVGLHARMSQPNQASATN